MEMLRLISMGGDVATMGVLGDKTLIALVAIALALALRARK